MRDKTRVLSAPGCMRPYMQVSITVKVWSVSVNDPPETTPVNTVNCWLRPAAWNHATGKAPAVCPPGGFLSATATTGAFAPWAQRGGDRYLVGPGGDVCTDRPCPEIT